MVTYGNDVIIQLNLYLRYGKENVTFNVLLYIRKKVKNATSNVANEVRSYYNWFYKRSDLGTKAVALLCRKA